MACTNLTVELEMRPKWWFAPAVYVAALTLGLGLVRDAANAEYYDGVEPAEDRVARWLAKYAFSIESRLVSGDKA